MARSVVRSGSKNLDTTRPEGPYEGSTGLADAIPGDAGPLLDFIDQLEVDTDQSLGLKSGYRELRIATELLRRHLTGNLVTSTALALASGLTYGTAMRALQNMEQRGLIIKRARTDTGKSYSLHPSALLLTRWEDYARRLRAIVYSTSVHVQATDGADRTRLQASPEARSPSCTDGVGGETPSRKEHSLLSSR